MVIWLSKAERRNIPHKFTAKHIIMLGQQNGFFGRKETAMKVYAYFAGSEEEAWELDYEALTAKDKKAGEPAKTVRDMLKDDFNTTFPEGEEPVVLINGEPGSLDHEIEAGDEIDFPELEEPADAEEG